MNIFPIETQEVILGTNGIYGFKSENKTLVNRVFYDGYPNSLGMNLLKLIVFSE